MKLSWHVQRILPWMRPAAAQLGLEWIKIVNPPSGVDPFPEVPRKCLRFWHDPDQESYIRDGVEGGQRYVRDYLARMRERPWGTVFETANEPDCNSNDGLRNLRLYSIGAMQEADRHGITLCILNLAQGNPHDNGIGRGAVVGSTAWNAARATERWKLEQLAEAVVYAAENGHYVALHTYWLPNRGIGPLDRWHSLGRAEWNVARWFEMGVDPLKLKLLINENGVDGLIENQIAGWQTRSNLTQYAQDVAAFEARMRQLPWALTHMLFTVGFERPWDSYEHSENDLRVIHAALPRAVTPPPPPPSPPTVTAVRLRIEPAEFEKYLDGIRIIEPYDRVCIHHTYKPDLATWLRHGGQHWIGAPERVGALERFYRSRKPPWTRFPHLFVAPDGIWVLGNLALDGAGVSGRNAGVRHVEIVGNHMTELPAGVTLDNAVLAAAALLRKANRGVDRLTYHRALRANTACPGAAFISAWNWFRNLVAAKLEENDVHKLEAAIEAEAQKHVIPDNPTSAFARAAAPLGRSRVSREFDVAVGGVTYRAQVFQAGDGQQHIVYTRVGDWANLRWFTRKR